MTNFVLIKDRELFFKVVLLSTLTIGAYSNVKKYKSYNGQPIKLTHIQSDRFGDFDKVQVLNNPEIIAKMISAVKPRLSSIKKRDFANKIHQVLLRYNINPQIVVAIIDTESSFNQNLVSSTGDLSMAQVNVEIWNKEFHRLGMEIIDIDRIKNDETYSLEVMAKILDILRARYERSDRRWYARYHSKNQTYKKAYLYKLEARMKSMEKLYLAEKKGVKKSSKLLALSN